MILTFFLRSRWLLFPLFSTYFYTTLAVTLCNQTAGAALAAGLLISLVACAAPRTRLRTGLSLIGGDDFRQLGSEYVNPQLDEIPQWSPLGVDLSGFAGQSVTLRLQVRFDWPIQRGDCGWWGSPPIAIEANSEAS